MLKVFTLVSAILILVSHETCWLGQRITTINETQIVLSAKYQFSLHPSSGKILAKQHNDKNKAIYYGDFGVLRMYAKNAVTVYEGAYMKITGLIHIVDPWLNKKYGSQNVIQLQVLYGFAFGKRQGNFYEQIGVSYFIAAADQANQTVKDIGKKITNKLINIEEGKKLKLQTYFKANSANLVNNLYFYKVPSNHLLSKEKQSEKILWILHRNVLQIDMKNLNRLKQSFEIANNIQKSEQNIKVFAAKLRGDNKKQTNAVLTQRQENDQQEQSNSCPQNQQL